MTKCILLGFVVGGFVGACAVGGLVGGLVSGAVSSVKVQQNSLCKTSYMCTYKVVLT